jgi:AbrB family transcriptional regulator (stage V sporulation protein T)
MTSRRTSRTEKYPGYRALLCTGLHGEQSGGLFCVCIKPFRDSKYYSQTDRIAEPCSTTLFTLILLQRSVDIYMKATGIVRRIDDLGRVVIPKEIRRTMRIREGDPLEIFTDRDGEVILKKYSPIGELGDYANEYVDSLHEATDHIALISDRDIVIAVSGAPRKEFVEKRIGDAIEHAMDTRELILINKPGLQQEYLGPLVGVEDDKDRYSAYVISPIITEEAIGAVVLCSKDTGVEFGTLERKLASTAAGFLAKQMED